MPECGNCGRFVTRDYERVFRPPDEDQVRACPGCPDRIRERGNIRDARSPRRTTRDEELPEESPVAAAGGQP